MDVFCGQRFISSRNTHWQCRACEKYLKTFLAKNKITIKKTHNLVDLGSLPTVEEAKTYLDFVKDTACIIKSELES